MTSPLPFEAGMTETMRQFEIQFHQAELWWPTNRTV